MRYFSGLLLLILAAAPLAAKPKGDCTVVGCLIVEMTGSYPGQEGPVYREHPIRIECEYLDKKGNTKQYGYMTKTDELGYFKLEQTPAGEYVLKAVEFTFEHTGRVTLASKYGRAAMSEESRYWGMMPGMMMDNASNMLQDQIVVESRDGIIDLGITYIQINAIEEATGTSMPFISPDGRPPWQRISVKERGAIINLYLVTSSTFASLENQPVSQNNRIYSKKSPAAYFGLE